jgi:copper chaperone CopZ
MRTSLLFILLVCACSISLRAADVTAKISHVHLCCKSCVTGVEKAVSEVTGATAAADKEAGTVSLTAPDAATLQKAADALVAAGYYGTTDASIIKVRDSNGAQGKKVQSLKVNGVHLCCGKCVGTVDEALKAVSGVKSHTAMKGAKSFEVTGDFNDRDVFAALEKAGLAGKAGK